MSDHDTADREPGRERSKLDKKVYERELYRLQTELGQGAAVGALDRPARRDPLRGTRRRRQGRHDQARHPVPQPAHRRASSPCLPRPSDSAPSGTSSATSSIFQPPARSCSSTAAGTTVPASSA